MSKVKTTEGEFRSQVITWLNAYIKDNLCPFELASADPSIKISEKETRFPDVQLWINRKAGQGFCGLELKLIDTAVDDAELLKVAAKKARAMNADYFVTWNMHDTIIWQTPKSETIANKDHRKKTYDPIGNITHPDDLWNNYKSSLLQARAIEIINDLSRLYHEGHLYEIDVDATFFVKILSEATRSLQPHILESLKETAGKNAVFRQGLYDWAVKQAIANFEDESFYSIVSYQIVYRLIGKILFYQTLRRFREDALPPMDFIHIRPDDVQNTLNELFELARAIDYQAVFEKDFPDDVILPNKSITVLSQLISELNKRNFSNMPQDIIGQVFEQLIPPEERHNLGQYFTREDLVDLICAFCIQKREAIVLDPTCGTGTFLLRAYDRLKCFGERDHKKLLSQLWGIDIAPFPAELATINLYRQNLSDYANFPKIITKDVFQVKPGQQFEFPPPKITTEAITITEQFPKFDSIIGNFPYIRQELIERRLKGYKRKLDELITEEWKAEYGELFDANGALLLSRQADIYTYLFLHVSKLLNKNGSRIGIVSSSAWLEVDYGYELQKFFLKNFKIIAVLETLAENWFEDVPIITCVTVVEKCDKNETRNDNIVKFVKFKKPLNEIIPQDMKIDPSQRWRAFDKLTIAIERLGIEHTQINGTKVTNTLMGVAHYENQDYRVRAVKQRELLEDLMDKQKTSKWGIYIRAPQVYYQILKKLRNKLVTFKEKINSNRGITTGINNFFHLDTDRIKHWRIEKEFLAPIATSPKEIDNLVIDKKKLKYQLFICHETKTELRKNKKIGALKYIEWGEKQVTKERGGYKTGGIPYPKVKSVSNRKLWYDVGDRQPGNFAINRFIRERFFFPLNRSGIFLGDVVFEGSIKKRKDALFYEAILNSTLTFLFVEVTSRFSMGDGFLTFYGPDIEELPVLNADLVSNENRERIIVTFNDLLKRPIEIIQDEVKMKDRQKFDTVVLQSIGLDPKIYLPLIYENLVAMVNERQNLGRMRRKTKKVRIAKDIEKLKEEIIKEILPDGLKQFPTEFTDASLKKSHFKEIPVCKEPLKLGNYFMGTQEVISDGGFSHKSSSVDEAKYLIYAQKPDTYLIKIPKQEIAIRKAITKYEKYLKELKNLFFKTFFERTHDHKLADILTHRVFEELSLKEI